ncbi:phosphoribosylaminoimidazole-succinocarboxamide synthase, chloroplastic-like [Gossypium australe]|uniref:phosphoribosylaminoimidazolesuccinocarboxamide synthase n=1 Tax=Gossypium australe TaxID=47621 RepID=A0A5B6UKJ1_9ROSI|nr:phosphoribosylaminoimidazole-succinocarboxamide synthase, chloroplastic-like [Gossypium australe]
MAECVRTTLNPSHFLLHSTKTPTQNPFFSSISSFEAKPNARKYPKISLSVMFSQNQSQSQSQGQTQVPSLDALLNSGRKEEVFASIKASLHNCLSETNLQLTVPGLKSKTRGKVRDVYDSGDYLVLVTTDRQSAFDRILASIPFKGQVLNETSLWWFNRTRHMIPNAVLSVPDKNVTIAKKCSVFPVEFVVRGFVTGSTETSLWTVYKNGVRNYCGNVLPNGLVKNQKLTTNILTPTTKAEDHDVPVTPDEIIERGLMTQDEFYEAREKALSLFEYGQVILILFINFMCFHGVISIEIK